MPLKILGHHTSNLYQKRDKSPWMNLRDILLVFACGTGGVWFHCKKVSASQCFKRFDTAERTLEGIEAVNMMRKGQKVSRE